jgi:hypothetical protein
MVLGVACATVYTFHHSAVNSSKHFVVYKIIYRLVHCVIFNFLITAFNQSSASNGSVEWEYVGGWWLMNSLYLCTGVGGAAGGG